MNDLTHTSPPATALPFRYDADRVVAPQVIAWTDHRRNSASCKSPLAHLVLDAFAESNKRPIQLRGDDAPEIYRSLRVYFWIGVAFKHGAQSLRDAARILRRRSKDNGKPVNIPLNHSQYTPILLIVKKFFGQHFGLEETAELFDSGGERSRARGLTPLGWLAWELTRDFVSDVDRE